jgi:hypothetical protein
MKSTHFLTYINLILIVISTVLQASVEAQENQERCGVETIKSIHGGWESWFDEVNFEQWMQDLQSQKDISSERSNITIPVIVHVVHSGESIGTGTNISAKQVNSQIAVLNEDFGKLSGTRGFNTHPVGASIGIEFCPAALDDNDNILVEKGIHRVEGWRSSWTIEQIEKELKPKTFWNPRKYFNIWVVNLNASGRTSIIGYAQYPMASTLPDLEYYEAPFQTDGIVIDYAVFGSSDKGSFPVLKYPNNLGRIATHETGHWLGLRHIWGEGGCNSDDYCDDTPVARAANYTCVSKISCSSKEMVENYMDYSPDACMNIFTNNQKFRMLAVLRNSPRRRELLESKVCEVPVSTKLAASDVKIFPLPANDVITVSIWFDNEENIENEMIQLRFYSANGQLTKAISAKMNTDNEIPLNDFPPGVYMLKISGGTFSKTFKVIKI